MVFYLNLCIAQHTEVLFFMKRMLTNTDVVDMVNQGIENGEIKVGSDLPEYSSENEGQVLKVVADSETGDPALSWEDESQGGGSEVHLYAVKFDNLGPVPVIIPNGNITDKASLASWLNTNGHISSGNGYPVFAWDLDPNASWNTRKHLKQIYSANGSSLYGYGYSSLYPTAISTDNGRQTFNTTTESAYEIYNVTITKIW